MNSDPKLSGKLRYLLFQIRDTDDPIIGQERLCFASAIGCDAEQITCCNLLSGQPSQSVLDRHDLVLIGGSGDYSAADNPPGPPGERRAAPWLGPILETLAGLHEQRKPTFASCWGFQALARSLGGQVIHDPQHAELGPTKMQLTSAGKADPVFGLLPAEFLGHSGHEDRVKTLPNGAVLLASSELVECQAYTFAKTPIFATQFHPELTRTTFLQRVARYPKYLKQTLGISLDEFTRQCEETPAANGLLKQMIRIVF